MRTEKFPIDFRPSLKIIKNLTNPTPLWLSGYFSFVLISVFFCAIFFPHFVYNNFAFYATGILIFLCPFFAFKRQRSKQFYREFYSGDATCYYLTTKKDFIDLLKQDRITRVVSVRFPFLSTDYFFNRLILAVEQNTHIPILVTDFTRETLAYTKRLCKAKLIPIEDENGNKIFDPEGRPSDPWDKTPQSSNDLPKGLPDQC